MVTPPTFFPAEVERSRAAVADDARYTSSGLYFFELRIPGAALEAGAPGEIESFLFPLVINPTSIEMVEPFTLMDTPGLDGSLYLEENGIIRRGLRIEGTTGFKPKRLPMNYMIPQAEFTKVDRSYNLRGENVPTAFSGQRHFQFLQDRVFRLYGDLKRNPEYAKDTELLFHNQKDQEHWKVAPRQFVLRRMAPKGTLYYYLIELLVYDKAQEPLLVAASPDSSILDTFNDIRNGVTKIREAIASAKGAINELTRVVNEITRVVTSFSRVFEDALGLVNTVDNFLNGVTNAITAPIDAFNETVTAFEDMIATIETMDERYADQVKSSVLALNDSLNRVAVATGGFSPPPGSELQRVRNLSQLSTSTSSEALSTAAANPPGSLRAFASTGSGVRAGDLGRSLGESGVDGVEPKFSSLVERTVAPFDTLPSLAAKHMGDARLWRQIAVVNKLKYPYISAHALPGTVSPGSSLLIPSNVPSVPSITGAGVIGARVSESAEARLLGRDLEIEFTDDGKLDVKIDTMRGLSDAARIDGIKNLVQAVRIRVTTERESESLTPRLGVRRIIGLGFPEVDEEITLLRISEAVLADPRVQALVEAKLNTSNPDAVDCDLTFSVRGFDSPVSTRARVG